MSWVRQLGEWIAGAAAFLGPGGVFLLALADSALIPMPQGVDALLLAQGIASPRNAYLAAVLAVLGSTIGSVALYFVARRAGHAMLRRYVSERGIRHLGELVGRFGAGLLIPVTLIPLPLPMKPVVIASGIFQMPLVPFCAAIALSRVLRYCGIVFLAVRFGDQAMSLAMENVHLAGAGCAVLVTVFIAVHRYGNRWLDQTGEAGQRVS